jgi:hypothetical protein
MADTLTKLRPDRDLQCYYFQPSAIAALSKASATGFTLSGTWRQQFDWAVVEWNRDNTFEHPMFRNLPDGDLSGITLSYQESRTNCIPMDSDLYPTVDWPSLRIWADPGTGEQVYYVKLMNYATAAGSYVPATATMTLGGTPTAGDYIGVSFLSEQYNYQLYGTDTIDSAITQLAAAVNSFSPTMAATASGSSITLTYVGTKTGTSTTGAGGNRLGVYGFVSGAGTEQWVTPSAQFSGGQSPTAWKVTLPFGTLTDVNGAAVPTNAVRKMRWTYAADLQAGSFARSEFSVEVTQWTVTGTNLSYSVAGPGSMRIEDHSSQIVYSGAWAQSVGNFSGSTIHYTTEHGDSLTCSYTFEAAHSLYLGTRITYNSGTISVAVDGQAAVTVNLLYPGEDVLVRHLLGQLGAGPHTVTITYTGPAGNYFYFDFLEMAIPAQTLPVPAASNKLTLATDWDTEHSQVLAAERTAWMLASLGFMGRANHYAGALWFYEIVSPGNVYASGTVTFSGTPVFGQTTTITLDETAISHLNNIGDTAETLALAFEFLINYNSTGVWAKASGATLTIFARVMGSAGNAMTLAASGGGTGLTVSVSGATLAGGVDGTWLTDLNAAPRLNRAARDWHAAYFAALRSYGIDVAAAFSTELGNGDPSVSAGIGQRYLSGDPVLVNTPALQTNFSPQSRAYWQEVYLEMAGLQAAAGLTPYLQFGEVQWWYFPELDAQGNPAGMTFYDAYTTSTFEAQYGKTMAQILTNTADPSATPDEAAFLSNLIGVHTAAIRAYVQASYPNCRFEVLYPPDVNNYALTQVINYPTNDWTPVNLTCLKTENFGFTLGRNLDLARTAIQGGYATAFPPAQRSHLVGISDASTSWLKESEIALGDALESVVLFALDQYCLIGYPAPLAAPPRRSVQLG